MKVVEAHIIYNNNELNLKYCSTLPFEYVMREIYDYLLRDQPYLWVKGRVFHFLPDFMGEGDHYFTTSPHKPGVREEWSKTKIEKYIRRVVYK